MIRQMASSDLRVPRTWSAKVRSLKILVTVLFTTASAAIAEQIDYELQVKPVFAARCKACHGALKQEGGLRLDTGALARQGGDSGQAIAPGKAGASVLLERITADVPAERMPQEGEPLTTEQIAAIREWIDQGARSPADEQAEPE